MMTLIAIAISVAYFLQLGCGFRAAWRGLFLGACDPYRYNAAWALGWKCDP